MLNNSHYRFESEKRRKEKTFTEIHNFLLNRLTLILSLTGEMFVLKPSMFSTKKLNLTLVREKIFGAHTASFINIHSRLLFDLFTIA